MLADDSDNDNDDGVEVFGSLLMEELAAGEVGGETPPGGFI